MPKKTDKSKRALSLSNSKKSNNIFEKKATPVKVKNPKELFLFECPNCSNIHFRHGGYVEQLTPWIHGGDKKEVSKESLEVMICTKCKKSYVWTGNQMYDVTKHVDVKAWEKTEKELQKGMGPGGNC